MVRSELRGELSPRVFQYGINPAVRICNAGVPRAAARSMSVWRRDLSTSFILAASISVLFTIIIVVGSLRQAFLPKISTFEEEDAGYSFSAPLDKESFLARLNTQQQRTVAAKVHYVSEIIRSTVPKNTEVNRLAYAIVAEALQARVDPLFVAAVIKSESTFNKNARSYVGATGLMQLMPETARFISKDVTSGWRGYSQLTDPVYNIRLGIAYLKSLQRMYDGNKELMLIAYNWGPANLNEALKNRLSVPQSTKKYARTIIGDHARWKLEYAQRMNEFQYFDVSAIG